MSENGNMYGERDSQQMAELLENSFKLQPRATDRKAQAIHLLKNKINPQKITVDALMEDNVVRDQLIKSYARQHPDGFTDFEGHAPMDKEKPMKPEDAIRGELTIVWDIMSGILENIRIEKELTSKP